jgi:CheY-like chemotaxis protein
MLAHELRNPLSAISNAVRLARLSHSAEGIDWSNEVIERQTQKLARLIDDLLDVSRITRGKIRLKRELIDGRLVLQGAVEVVRPLIEERKHELTVSAGPGALLLDADPVRLEQILINLLTNAAKYTESGGHIRVTAEHDGPDVVFKVRDTGIGIPPEMLAEVFELFAQGERSIARSEGGLGIGLTVVRSLAELHGGRVAATSEGPGRGSEFIVRLPAARRPAVERREAPPTSPDSSHKAARILVVDDNADTARGLARLLMLLGHDVRIAYDGKGALEIADQFTPEFILMDIGLPGMDGYQVVSQLRQQECGKHSVIIAVSGYGQEEDRRRSREAGFDHHLVKPVDHKVLLVLLSRSKEGIQEL